MSEPHHTADFVATASVAPNGATRTGGGDAADARPLPLVSDDFHLLEEIGHGGMGIVFRARDVALDREVAVKLLQHRYGPESATAARFVDEARITGQLQHPGIPAVYRVGLWPDGRPYLAMKLIKGKTLDALLDAGERLDPLAVFEALARAVGYAHAHGVIHRDLKPHNVMVGAFGEVQVMDWGLAKLLGVSREPKAGGDDPTATSTAIVSARESDGTLTVAGSVLGTPAFMPPEQAAGELDKVDTRADVFGLGAILCVLLTGEPPFEGGSAESVRLNAVRGKTEAAFARLDASGADPELVALCKRCLAFEPGDRPATATAVADAVAALRRATDDRAKQAERDKLAAEVQAGEQRKRRRAVVVAAGVVVAVFAAGAGAALWQAQIARQKAADAERARRDAEDEQRKADAARDAAEVQRKRAQARLDKAVQAIEIALTRVSSPVWALRPELQGERRAIVGEAIAFFRTIGEEEGKDPAVRRQVARAQMLIAAAYMALADYDNCEAAAAAARAGYAELVAEFPDDVRVRRGQIDAVAMLGHLAALRGRYADAEARYEEGLALAKAARQTAPASLDAAVALADMHTSLGLFNGLRRPDVTRKHHEAALAIGEEVRGQHPNDFRATMVVFAALINLASGELSAQPREALRKFDRADALLTELDRMTPPTGRSAESFQIAKAALLVYRGALRFRDGHTAEGLAEVKEGNALMDGLRAVYPKSFPIRIHWLEFRVILADLDIRLGRVEAAEKLFDELRHEQDAIAAENESAVWVKRIGASQRSGLVVELAKVGRAAAAEKEARELMAFADPTNTFVIRYNAACTFAQLAAHGPPDRREGFAAEAVRLLDDMAESTYFQRPSNVAHLWTDDDLLPLRGRADYQTFAARMRKLYPSSPPPLPAAPPPRAKG